MMSTAFLMAGRDETYKACTERGGRLKKMFSCVAFDIMRKL